MITQPQPKSPLMYLLYQALVASFRESFASPAFISPPVYTLPEGSKLCCGCGEVKNWTDFYIDSTTGRPASRCKPCAREVTAKTRLRKKKLVVPQFPRKEKK